MPVSDLYATQTPTPNKVPISDGSGTLNDWVTTLFNPMTTDQDIIVATVGGTPDRLGVGAPGQVLTVGSGGLVDWEDPTGGLVNPMTTSQDLIVGGMGGLPARLGVGTVGQVLTVGSGGIVDWETPAASGGSVTSVSVVSANGFAGTVATATTTPAITLSTTITGILKGNGTAISAATTTGTGDVVLATSPTLITPAIGAATGTSLVLSGGLTSGAVAGATGFVALKGLTSGTVTLSVADAAGTNTFKLPATAGSNTNVLATDGSGNLFWQAAGSGSGTVNSGTASQVTFYASTGTAVSGAANLTYNNSTGQVSATAVINATSTTTGTLVNAGGMGLGGSLYMGGSTLAMTGGGSGTSGLFNVSGTLDLRSQSGLNLSPSTSTGGPLSVAACTDLVQSSNVSFRTWQASGGSSTGRGLYVQMEGIGNVTVLSSTASPIVALSGCLSGGSFTSQTATPSGANVRFSMNTYSGSTWVSPASMFLVTTELHSSTARGSKIEFRTTPNTTTTTAVVLTIDQDASATFTGGVKTGAPSGGTAAFWKFGVVSVTSPTSPNRTIELDVGGTRYFLAAKTTND